MLKKGDVISYGTTGCVQSRGGECEQTVKGQKKLYHMVPKPVHQINSTLYVHGRYGELKTRVQTSAHRR
ncbi:MAG: hypothetical protein ACLTD2_02115 [Ruminococcus sp.]